MGDFLELLKTGSREPEMLLELSKDAEEVERETKETEEEPNDADDAEEAKNSFTSAQALRLIKLKKLIAITNFLCINNMFSGLKRLSYRLKSAEIIQWVG